MCYLCKFIYNFEARLTCKELEYLLYRLNSATHRLENFYSIHHKHLNYQIKESRVFCSEQAAWLQPSIFLTTL